MLSKHASLECLSCKQQKLAKNPGSQNKSLIQFEIKILFCFPCISDYVIEKLFLSLLKYTFKKLNYAQRKNVFYPNSKTKQN